MKAIDDHHYGLLTNKQVKILDIRDGTIVNEDIKQYKSQKYNFEKLDISGHNVAVGQEDGIVKLYDLRYFHKRSMNNIDLRMDTEVKGQYYKRKGLNRVLFDSIEIVAGTKDIFCSYDNSAYLISSASRDDHSSMF